MKDAERDEEVQSNKGVRVAPMPGGFAPADTHLGSTVTGWLQTGETVAPAVGVVPLAYEGSEDPDDAFDPDLGSRVESALAEDGRIESRHIVVSINENVVELTGHVPTEREKRDAGDACARVPGVRAVENRLAISPGHG